ADLRRPHLHQIFGLSNEAGLTTWVGMSAAGAVRGKDSTSAPLPLQKTQVPNLMVLTSGPIPPNPAEILASQRMADLLVLLKSQAEYVLLDAPPIIAVTDAAVLSPRVDGVLLVVNAGKSRHDFAIRAGHMIRHASANLLSVFPKNATIGKSEYE